MHALPELQSRFVGALLRREERGAEQWLRPGGVTPAQRLAIYRGNARENFAVALEAAFPVILALTGREAFRQIAWAYQREFPSPTGNLFQVGERLPAFLESRLAGTADESLIDVARLEWAVQEALVAADSDAVLDLCALAAVPAARHGELCFRLHPAVRLLGSRHPLFALWQAHRSAGPVPSHAAAGAPVRALAGPAPDVSHVLVQRSGQGVELHRLPAADHACLAGCASGEDFDTVATKVAGLAPEADLGAILARWSSLGVIVGFSVGAPWPGPARDARSA